MNHTATRYDIKWVIITRRVKSGGKKRKKKTPRSIIIGFIYLFWVGVFFSLGVGCEANGRAENVGLSGEINICLYRYCLL